MAKSILEGDISMRSSSNTSMLRMLLCGVLAVSLPHAMLAQNEVWRATWSASPSAWNASMPEPPAWKALSWKTLADSETEETIRDIVHLSSGGDRCRVRISNAFGDTPLLIRDVHAAIQQAGSDVRAASDHALTFGGESSISIPPGAGVLSDSVTIELLANTNLAISFTTKGPTSSYTIHFMALQTSYYAPGAQAGAATLHDATAIPSWPLLTEVQVTGRDASEGTVVAFGDSITDGAITPMNANHRWPNRLFERLQTRGIHVAVTNAGIAGNRLLHNSQGLLGTAYGVNALARFDRDVLSQAGVRYVIVLMGTNDIAQPGSGGIPADSAVSAKAIEVALSQLADRAHEHGIHIMVGTLPPFGDATAPGYYTAEKGKMRDQVNQWIRKSKNFDAVADFDRALRDPITPNHLRHEFDGGDHLHPSEAGAKAMADAIPLTFFSAVTDHK
jgi:lysophospholipase L1-like esterase